MLVFDTETHLIRPGLLAPPLVCVSYARSSNDVRLALREDGTSVVEAALDAGEVLVGHNIAFDFAVLATHRPCLWRKVFQAYADGRVRDTQIRQQLIDIQNGCLNFPRADGTRGYKLLNLEQHYLGKDRSAEKANPNAWRFRYAELDGLPLQAWPEEAILYAKEDAAGTLVVFCAQTPDFREQDADLINGADYEDPLVDEVNQVRAAWCLHLCSLVGLRTNKAAVDALEMDMRERFITLQRRMVEEGLIRIERATTKEITEGKVDFWDEQEQLLGGLGAFKYRRNMAAIRARVELAYEKLGLRAPRTDPTESNPFGQVKTDASDTLAYSGDPILEELGEGGPISTILKTFVPTLKRGTEVAINARFNTLVETGRPSCADPNLYNIPRGGGVRECFEARPGYVFCSVDYDCAELRALAQVCLWLGFDSSLAKFFQRDPYGDPHLEMAAYLLEIESSAAKRRLKSACWKLVPELTEAGRICPHCEVKDMRQMSKAFNFGFPGGMGVDTMIKTARRQYGVILTRERALEGRQAWLNRWPEMRLYFAHVSRLVGLGEATVQHLKPGGGPHRKRGGVGYCDGCNGFFQGLLADAFKHALWRITQEAWLDESSPLFGTRLLVPLYDEAFAEIPEVEPGAAHAAAYRLADVQRLAAQEWIPDVPITCAPALSYRWTKDAKERFDAGGRLIAWDSPRVREAA